MDTNTEIAVARELGHRRAEVLLPDPLRRRRGLRDRAAGGDGGRDRGRARWWSATARSTSAPASGSARCRRGRGVGADLAGRRQRLALPAWACPRPAATVAMIAQRYMHVYGATSEDFGAVSVADRKHAAINPKAYFYGKPITLEEHQARGGSPSRCGCWTAARRATARVAIVVTSAGAGPGPAAAARGHRGRRAGQRPGPVHDDQLLPGRAAACPRWAWSASQLWQQSGLGPADMQTAMLYDHFTPYVLMQLEELGLLPARRGQGLHRRRRHRARRHACRSTPTAASSARPTSTA